jgi:hypothetical protein
VRRALSCVLVLLGVSVLSAPGVSAHPLRVASGPQTPATTVPPTDAPVPPLEPVDGEEDQGEVVDPVDPNAPEPTPPPLPDAPAIDPTGTTVPAGCDAPIEPAASFIGVVVARDDQFAVDGRSARFTVAELKQGSLDGYEVNGLVDVDFGADFRYLDIGSAYLVTAEINELTQRLTSRAKPEAVLFGGDQVVGIDDRSDLNCPELINPIITMTATGESIDTGVFSPLFAAKRSALERILRPLVAALAGLALLVFAKRIGLWMTRRLRYWFDQRTIRRITKSSDLATDR